MIALSGYIGSGKGTVARHLVSTHGYQEFSFASPVKDCLSAIFHWPRDLLEGITTESRVFRETVDDWWSEKLGIPEFTPRFAMRNYGTEVMRNHFHTDVWVLSAQKKISASNRQLVCSDVRFANEDQMLKDEGALSIHIYPAQLPVWHDCAVLAANGCTRSAKKMQNDYPDVHLSDYSWLGFKPDVVIHNIGTVDELIHKIDCAINKAA